MANEYIRKEWQGGTVRTTLNGNIGAADMTFSVTDGSSFPSGTSPFIVVIDRGTASEEKLIISSRATNSFTVLQRGYDGSAGQSHTTGAYVEHVLDAYTVDQANSIASTMNTAGDMLYKPTSGQNTLFSRLAIGTAGQALTSSGSAPTWGQIGTAGIAANAVTEAKIATSVAGAGLAGGGGVALSVNPDNVTVEVVSDTVRLKDGGVTSAKIADDTIVNADINSAAGIVYSKLALSNGIVNADVNTAAGIALTKLASGASAQVVLGNATGVPTYTTVSGDVTISNTGVTTIGAAKITNAMLSTTAGAPGGAWNAWTPTLSGGTLGNGTAAGRYIQIGKTVYMQATITWGTTSNFTGLAINLPVTAQASVVGPQFQVMYSSGGLTYYDGAVLATTTAVTCQATGTAGAYAQSANISNTIPFTWAAGNVVHLAGVYEAA